MHQIQKTILNRLLTKNHQKYSTLTAGYDFEENIVFHLKQLMVKNLIKKENEFYSLTAEGVKEAKNEVTGLKMFFVGFVCEINGKYLVREHLAGKTNFYNLPSGKPQFGEDINRALSRIFYELTCLKLKPENFNFLSLHLKTVKTSAGEILFDDAFAIYEVKINNAEKIKLKQEIKLLSLEEIKKLPYCWPEIDLCIINKIKKNYLAYEFSTDYIL